MIPKTLSHVLLVFAATELASLLLFAAGVRGLSLGIAIAIIIAIIYRPCAAAVTWLREQGHEKGGRA